MAERSMRYSEKVMDHFMHPRNVGRIKDPDGVGKAGNPICGDMLIIYLKVKDEVIVDVKFETFGCAAAIATSSMVTELVKGKTIEEALRITNKTVAQALDGLPPVKMHCSLLAEDGLRGAIKEYRSRERRAKARRAESRASGRKSEKKSGRRKTGAGMRLLNLSFFTFHFTACHRVLF